MVNVNLSNTSCSTVTVECCTNNSRELTLSWYKGTDRLKKTSSPDLFSTLSLSLEIQLDDEDKYICAAENPVEEKITVLNTNDSCVKDRGMMVKYGNTMFFFSVFIHFAFVQK